MGKKDPRVDASIARNAEAMGQLGRLTTVADLPPNNVLAR